MADDLRHASRKYYTVSFADRSAKSEFVGKAAALSSFSLIREENNEVYLSIDDSDLNELIALLAATHATAFSNRRETLEDYFLRFYKEDKDFGGALK